MDIDAFRTLVNLTQADCVFVSKTDLEEVLRSALNGIRITGTPTSVSYGKYGQIEGVEVWVADTPQPLCFKSLKPDLKSLYEIFQEESSETLLLQSKPFLEGLFRKIRKEVKSDYRTPIETKYGPEKQRVIREILKEHNRKP